jgi:hypothetical protein
MFRSAYNKQEGPYVNEAVPLLFQIAAGIALAACAGLRAFLPLFVTGIVGRLGWVDLSGSFEWLSSTPALVVLGVAVTVELLSDKIPVVDHALDVLNTFLKPAAGTALMASMLTNLTPLQAIVLGIVAGGGSAGLVHLAKAKLRLGSSLLTAGLANPLLSLAEDGVAFVGTAAAFLVPLAAATFAIGAMALLVVVLVLLARRLRAPAAASAVSAGA